MGGASIKKVAWIACVIAGCPRLSLPFQSPENPQLPINEYVQLRLAYDPTLAYALGLPPSENMHLPDRSPTALGELRSQEDRLLAEIRSKGSASAAVASADLVIREDLESRQALRVCRTEYWDVNHMLGWQVELPGLAATLPSATAAEQARVLRLWGTLPEYLATDVDNLRSGLAEGHSVPRAVVARVLEQIDALLSTPVEKSPLYAAALGHKDEEFAAALRAELAGQVEPAIRKYVEFLRSEYLPRARDSPGLSGIPDGLACYRAFLRRYTTTADPPKFVFDTGEKTVTRSTREIKRIGMRLYRTTKLPVVVERIHADRRNRFVSPDQLLDFSIEIVRRAEQRSRNLFLHLPMQTVSVKPIPQYQQGTGVSSSYAANPDAKQHATFWIAVDQWSSETRGAAEITAVHETIPGHHLQIAIARELELSTVLSKLVSNAAYSEGWANYAERLAEESGIDDDDYERIQRRVLAGRSLVIDPGIHAFNWTRERAEAYAMETGMNKEQADDVIDRISVEPGQITSYEIGGLEILAIREKARRQLGKSFDLRAFHQCVLKNGPLPLGVLSGVVANCLVPAPK